MNPTSEQWSILSAVQSTSSNLMVNALAGTGKTSTLKLVELAANDLGVTPILYLVFNSANAKAAEYKPRAEDADKRMGPTTTVKTLNSLGHALWGRVVSHNLEVSKTKTQDLLKELIKELPKHLQSEAWDSFWDVVSGVAMAKAIGYCPERYFPNAKVLARTDELQRHLEETPAPIVLELIDELLRASIQQSYRGIIDFNDQIYMPALFGAAYPKFPLVMIDEYQDLNPVNHAMVDKLLGKARGIGVGDPWQSIYAFRGAKIGGMADARAKHSMTELSLSVSFRCPEAVVRAAHWRVPHFKWIKSGGHVESLHGLRLDDIPEEAVFICRNNAPLFRLGFRLLSSGRSVTIAGSDINSRVVGIMRKLGPESLTRNQCYDAIEQWQRERIAKGSKTAGDLAECMRIFCEHGTNLGQAIGYAEHLFAQRGTIRMMTGHKAKGLEFDTVYHLDPGLCREDEQDQNLRYVITTRAANKLYTIDSEAIE